MAFLLNKTSIASHFSSRSQKTDGALSLPRRGYRVDLGAREKALLAEDPALKRFKSEKKTVWRVKTISDILTLVVVTGYRWITRLLGLTFYAMLLMPGFVQAEAPFRKPASRLFKPLIGGDGKIYSCSERSLFAFTSNGSISWTVPLGFKCNVGLAPTRDDSGKIYLVAENRVLEINPLNIGTSKSVVQIFFGPEPGQEAPGEITGLSVSTLSPSVFITVSKRGLFAYLRRGKLLWSVGPVLQQFGYRLGCRRGLTDCYFTSIPVVDQCEASIYISNSQGELYSLSTRSPYFRWIQDLSSFDKAFTVTAGNNGRLYVTVPVKALLLALDVSSGSMLWQRSIGPLSTTEYAPIVDSNGWISIGSLDGFLYSFSPDGILKKYEKLANQDSVFQVSPVLDCSGYAIYVSQTKMEAKISNTIGEYTYVSAMKPISVVFMLLVPATGSIYWSESYPDWISSFISESDLQHFVLDEEVLLAFLAASKTGNPLKCRTIVQKLSSSCSKTMSKQTSIYTGNERAILLFLLFETVVLIVLAGLLKFCCIFWRKKKIQGQGLRSFLEKRHSLRMKKKAFDKKITELERKATEEASASSEVLEDLGDLVRERESIERKLSTTYSLGRDGSRSILPILDGKPKSHTLSHTSSGESSSGSAGETSSSSDRDNVSAENKGKTKAPAKEESSTDDEVVPNIKYRRRVSVLVSSSREYDDPFSGEQERDMGDRNKMFKKRSLSSTN